VRRVDLILRTLLTLAALFPLVGSAVALTPSTASAAPDPDVEVQLGIILDGSGSILPDEWTRIVEGLADAIEDPDCTPRDESVELTIVVFGWHPDWHAEVYLDPTPISEANVHSIADTIRDMEQPPYGATPMACGIRLAADTMRDSPNFDASKKQVLNMMTDGEPNICCTGYDGYPCGAADPPPPAARTSAVAARNYAITTLQMTPTQDEFDIEYVGTINQYSFWLKNEMAFPQPGYYMPPYNGTGWVRVVDDAQEAADTFCEKIQLSLVRTLTMQVNGCGTTTPAVGSYGHNKLDVVNISATPCAGWEFVNWTGDVTDPNSPTTTVVMNTDKVVTANFSCTATLTMAVNPSGKGTVTPALGPHDYTCDTVVSITATDTVDEWTFLNWTGDVDDPNSASTTVTVSEDMTVTANFAPPVILTVSTTGCGSTGPAVGLHDYALGTVVGLTADPCDWWQFVSWSGPVANPSSSSTTVTMDGDKQVTANFEPIPVTLTIAVDGCGSTLPLVGSYIYNWGDVVSVSASACTNWVFDNWTGDVDDPNSASTTISMEGDKTITAHFLPPYDLTMQVSGCGITDPGIGVHTYPPNTDVPISAMPCPGWQFDDWTGDVGNSTDPSTTVMMDADKTVTANFSRIPLPLGLQLAVILDGSASIDPDEWATEIDGLYDAIMDGVIPHDGSVELTVIQFADAAATTEVPPTILDDGNWADVAADVQGIVKRNGITPIALGISKAVEEITGSPNFGISMKQTINISSDVGEFTLIPGEEEAVAERNAAIAAGIDEICAEGIGDIRGVDMTWLRDEIVWPQPGTIAPPFTAGWVYKVDTAAQFTDAIGEKITFVAPSEALVISSGQGGSVTEPGEGIFTYPSGTVVDLTATPDFGWVFSGWTGAVADPSSATTTVTMNDYHIISAHFTEGRILDVSSGTGGSVTEPGEGSFTYLPGTIVDLTASPDLGWAFDGWTGDVANPSSASTTVTMDADKSVSASFFEIPTYTLTVSSGTGGSVTDPGEGPFVYNEGTVVDLTATPALGWAFTGWTGNVDDPLSATTTITMNADETVTASFYEVPIYRLAIGSTEGGSVLQPGEGVFEYSEGSVVDITAAADAGYAFDGWIGNVDNPWSSATTITMNQDELVTARFVRTYTLTITSGTGGSVTDPGEGVFVYKQDTVVPLTATRSTGWAFDAWTGAVDDPSSATTTITMTENRVVSASFVRAYILALSSSSGGTITEPGEGLFEYKVGTVVDLSAHADFGKMFLGWAGNVVDPSSMTTSITMYKNEVVVANFSGLTMLTLTVQVSGNGTVSPDVGTHEYAAGTVVNLLAYPDEDNAFVNWSGGVASPTSAATTVTMTSDKTVTANFLPTYTLTVQVSGDGTTTPAVGTHVYPAGTVVDVSAYPAPVRKFDYWTGDVADTLSAQTTVTIDSDKTITAHFSPITDGKTLTIVVVGSGATTPEAGSHLYYPGAVVQLTATPATGWEFISWSTNVANPTSPTTTVTMNQNKQIAVYFYTGTGEGTPPVPTPTPTPHPTRTPAPTRTPVPTRTFAPSPTPSLTASPTAAPVASPTPMFTSTPTSPPSTLMPSPTPTETPVEVPWSLVAVTVAAVVGVGVLFYALGRKAPK